ncbi:MAG: hypothetical protein JXR42_02030 [Gammaproteobacteria bacterium]|nr:hypothetical protein [Gammaproteobacteria bacterium]
MATSALRDVVSSLIPKSNGSDGAVRFFGQVEMHEPIAIMRPLHHYSVAVTDFACTVDDMVARGARLSFVEGELYSWVCKTFSNTDYIVPVLKYLSKQDDYLASFEQIKGLHAWIVSKFPENYRKKFFAIAQRFLADIGNSRDGVRFLKYAYRWFEDLFDDENSRIIVYNHFIRDITRFCERFKTKEYRNNYTVVFAALLYFRKVELPFKYFFDFISELSSISDDFLFIKLLFMLYPPVFRYQYAETKELLLGSSPGSQETVDSISFLRLFVSSFSSNDMKESLIFEQAALYRPLMSHGHMLVMGFLERVYDQTVAVRRSMSMYEERELGSEKVEMRIERATDIWVVVARAMRRLSTRILFKDFAMLDESFSRTTYMNSSSIDYDEATQQLYVNVKPSDYNEIVLLLREAAGILNIADSELARVMRRVIKGDAIISDKDDASVRECNELLYQLIYKVNRRDLRREWVKNPIFARSILAKLVDLGYKNRSITKSQRGALGKEHQIINAIFDLRKGIDNLCKIAGPAEAVRQPTMLQYLLMALHSIKHGHFTFEQVFTRSYTDGMYAPVAEGGSNKGQRFFGPVLVREKVEDDMWRRMVTQTRTFFGSAHEKRKAEGKDASLSAIYEDKIFRHLRPK